MHRRILVVDGALAFAGGVGIADVWTGDAQDPEHWRETHLRVEGPGRAGPLRRLLGELGRGHRCTSSRDAHRRRPELRRRCRSAGDEEYPHWRRHGRHRALLCRRRRARERLWLTTAYFAPDRSFEEVLCDAARRGVDVRILVNGQEVDKDVARQAGHRSYGKLLGAGVRIFEYDKTMMHAKVLLVDRGWANVGSGNLDNRSLDLDLEINVAVLDPDLVEELSAKFIADLDVARDIDLETWKGRPLRKRAAELATEVIRQSL